MSAVILALIVVGGFIVIGCSQDSPVFVPDTKPVTVDGGGVWGGGSSQDPAPFSWDDSLTPWTGNEISVADGGSVTWLAYPLPPKTNGGPLTAQVKAVLMNMPEGFEYLQWSFDPTVLEFVSNPLESLQNRVMEFGAEWASGSPRLADDPMSIMWRASQTEAQATVYVWNCDAAGNRGTLSASFTVNVTVRPTIFLYWDWGLTVNPVTGDFIRYDGDKRTWALKGEAWSQYKDKRVKADFPDPPGEYKYLQWSFNDPDSPPLGSTSDNKLKFVTGFAPAPLAANESTATIEHDTNRGAKLGQKVWVYNVDKSGVRPTDRRIQASAWFELDATITKQP